MRRPFLLLAVCAIITAVHAQKPPIKFGDVTLEQLKMSNYPKDSSVAAIVLADYGETTIEYSQNIGFQLKFERIKRIKILRKEGLEQANFSIDLYHNNSGDNEKVIGLKAVTYNLENGKIVETKVKSESIFKEKFDANWDVMKVTWPNVKEGSVIEITYQINSDFFFNLHDWQFQESIPVVWSEYRTRIPEYFVYDKYTQGYIPLTVHEETKSNQSIILNSIERSVSGNGFGAVTRSTINNERIEYIENRIRLVSQDVPAFKPEPFITSSTDYLSKINFELSHTAFPNQMIKNYMGSWEDINKSHDESENFGVQVKSNGFLKKTVEDITAGLTTQEEKAKAIYGYVKLNILWDESSRKYTSSLKKVFDEKKGNSADINFLLASMLEKADIIVNPVLLSTRSHGFVREAIPVSTQFNYVICEVNLGDKFVLLDATDKLLPFGVLPERCLNGRGFAVSKDGYRWIDLLPTVKSKTSINVDLVLNNSGDLNCKMQIDKTGYHALASRKKYLTKGESDYVKDFIGSRTWEIAKSEFQIKEVDNVFKETHDVVISDHHTSAGDMIYLNPFIINREESNPFKLEIREYPVDYGSAFVTTYILKITIPEGYAVEELPKSKIFMLPANAAKYSYNANLIGNVISIASNMAINKSLFVQEEYPHLREFYNQVVAKQAEQIVLKRK